MKVFDESPEEIIMSRFAPGPRRVTVSVINMNLLAHDAVDNYAQKTIIRTVRQGKIQWNPLEIPQLC